MPGPGSPRREKRSSPLPPQPYSPPARPRASGTAPRGSPGPCTGPAVSCTRRGTYQLLPDPPQHPRRRGSRLPAAGLPGQRRALRRRRRRLRPTARRGCPPRHGGPRPRRERRSPPGAPRPPSQRRPDTRGSRRCGRPREVTCAAGERGGAEVREEEAAGGWQGWGSR